MSSGVLSAPSSVVLPSVAVIREYRALMAQAIACETYALAANGPEPKAPVVVCAYDWPERSPMRTRRVVVDGRQRYLDMAADYRRQAEALLRG